MKSFSSCFQVNLTVTNFESSLSAWYRFDFHESFIYQLILDSNWRHKTHFQSLRICKDFHFYVSSTASTCAAFPVITFSCCELFLHCTTCLSSSVDGFTSNQTWKWNSSMISSQSRATRCSIFIFVSHHLELCVAFTVHNRRWHARWCWR